QFSYVGEDMNKLRELAYESEAQFEGRYSGRLPRSKDLEHSSINTRYVLTVLLKSVSVRLGGLAVDTIDTVLESKIAQSVVEAGSSAGHIEYEYFRAAPVKELPADSCLSIEDNGEFIYNDYHISVNLPASELPLTLRMKADGDRVHIKNVGTKKVSRL